MKLKDTRAAYDTFSAKASEISRHLNLAGIAIIWIFRIGDKSGGVTFSALLLWPLGGFVIALVLDLLQYIYGSIAWSVFHRYKEKKMMREKVDPESEFLAPPWINWPSIALFYSKIILTAVVYAFLIQYIAKVLLA
jgi:hypothetical protein